MSEWDKLKKSKPVLGEKPSLDPMSGWMIDTEPDYLRYYDEVEAHWNKVWVEGDKGWGSYKNCKAVLMLAVDKNLEYEDKLEEIRDITNQTGTAMTRLIKIREVLGDE